MKKTLQTLALALSATPCLFAKAYIPPQDNSGYNEALGIITYFGGGINQPGNLSISVDGKLSDGSYINFAGWATGVSGYSPTNVPAMWRNTENALGKATADDTWDVVVLGDAGSITLTFGAPICNGDGYDFAVFENSLNDTFLEFGFVEVSTDGSHFVRFPSIYLGSEPVGRQYRRQRKQRPHQRYNLGCKYMIGYGNGYDLEELKIVSDYIAETKGTGECQFSDEYIADFEANYSYLDLGNVNYVRIVDVVGDGNTASILSERRYTTPIPPTGSPGFDLSGVGVINAVPEPGAVAAIMGLFAVAAAAVRKRRG